jgi:hypothetical protein
MEPEPRFTRICKVNPPLQQRGTETGVVTIPNVGSRKPAPLRLFSLHWLLLPAALLPPLAAVAWP